MPNGFKKYLPVWLIAFITTIVLAYIFPIERNEIFNIVYYFIVATFAIQLLISYFAFKNEDNTVSQTTFIYSIVGIVMIFVVNYYCISKLIWHRPWVYAAVNIVVLALHYIFLIVVNTSLNKNVERDQHVKEKSETMLSLTKEVKALYDSTNNEDIYRLYEALKFADKRSKNKEIEKQIDENIKNIKMSDDDSLIKENVEKTIELINYR